MHHKLFWVKNIFFLYLQNQNKNVWTKHPSQIAIYEAKPCNVQSDLFNNKTVEIIWRYLFHKSHFRDEPVWSLVRHIGCSQHCTRGNTEAHFTLDSHYLPITLGLVTPWLPFLFAGSCPVQVNNAFEVPPPHNVNSHDTFNDEPRDKACEKY